MGRRLTASLGRVAGIFDLLELGDIGAGRVLGGDDIALLRGEQLGDQRRRAPVAPAACGATGAARSSPSASCPPPPPWRAAFSAVTAAASSSASLFTASRFCSACQAGERLVLDLGEGLDLRRDDLVDMDREDRAVLRVDDAAGVALLGREDGLQHLLRPRSAARPACRRGRGRRHRRASTLVSLSPNLAAMSASVGAAGQRVVGLVADLVELVERLLLGELRGRAAALACSKLCVAAGSILTTRRMCQPSAS